MRFETIITACLLALSIVSLSSAAYAGGHRPQGYGFNPAICGRLNIEPGVSQPLGDASVDKTGCHVRMAHGYPLPDPKCTPGAINPTVTADVLGNLDFSTECIRNRVTTAREKAVTYRWYGIRPPRHNHGRTQVCELDYLVPLKLGGADTLDNVWPQCGPKKGPIWKRSFRRKDLVENYLAKMVRDGKMQLWEAQRGIAKDWTQYLSAAKKMCVPGGCR